MTKETKIGLLVGLAFIILFAIILSEKGAARGTKSPAALTAADAATKTIPTGEGPRQPLHDAGRLPVDARLPSNAPSAPLASEVLKPTGRPSGSLSVDALASAGRLPSSVVEVLNQGIEDHDEEAEARPLPVGAEPTVSLDDALGAALARDTPVDRSGATPIGATDSASSPTPGAISPDASAAAPPTPGDEPRGSRPAPSTPPQAPGAVVIKTVHEVKPGESLGKIAARYYGRSTPERVEAIYNANREVLKNPQKVRANDKLKIPALEGHESQFELAPQFAPAGLIEPSSKPRDGQTRIPRDISNKLEGGAPRTGAVRPSEMKTTEAAASPRAATPSESGAGGAKPADPSRTAFTWYEVQKTDSLAKISKRVLGSEGRYREIFRLNADIIQDVNRLKPGMKIRLPVKGEAAGAGV